MQIKVRLPGVTTVVELTVMVKSLFKMEVMPIMLLGEVKLHVLAAMLKPARGKTILPELVMLVAVVSERVMVTLVAEAVLSERITAAAAMAPTAVMAGKVAEVVRSTSVPTGVPVMGVRVRMVIAVEAT